jgi:hypothetical protein
MFANEAAIAPCFLDQAKEFSDVLLLTAHNSFDRTQEVVETRMKSSSIVLETNSDSRHVQSEIMTRQMRRAFADFGADVVIPLDFDEFMPFEKRSELELFLSSLHCDVLEWNWQNLVPKALGNPRFFSSGFFSLHRRGRFRKVIVMRSAYLQDQSLGLFQGSHHVVTHQTLRTYVESKLQLFHIPIHGALHYKQKIILGAARVWHSDLGDIGGHWTSQAKTLLSGSEIDLESLSGCYPDLKCFDFHKKRDLDFSFPYVNSVYVGEEDSAKRALLSNSELISAWLLKSPH